MGTAVIGSEERTDDELSAPDRRDRAADVLDDAAILVTHGSRLGRGANAAVRPQVGPAHAGRRHPDDGIGGYDDRRVSALLESHVTRGVENCSSHAVAPLVLPVRGASPRRTPFTLPRGGPGPRSGREAHSLRSFARGVSHPASKTMEPRCRRTPRATSRPEAHGAMSAIHQSGVDLSWTSEKCYRVGMLACGGGPRRSAPISAAGCCRRLG
jgi:hypothetical protein